MMENELIPSPAALLATEAGSGGRFGYGDNRFAYRYLRRERVPREWDRERFQL